MNSMPFRQLKSFLKILIGVQYENDVIMNVRLVCAFLLPADRLLVLPFGEHEVFIHSKRIALVLAKGRFPLGIYSRSASSSRLVIFFKLMPRVEVL